MRRRVRIVPTLGLAVVAKCFVEIALGVVVVVPADA